MKERFAIANAKLSTWKFLSLLTASSITATSVGVGGFFIYKAIENSKINSIHYREMKNPKTIWFNSGSTNSSQNFASPDWDFQIKVYPYENGEYWLDEQGLKKLRNTLKKRLYHGQEIIALDDIVFGNTNIVDENNNGLYFPLTKEIFLNVSQWEKDNEISDEKKIEGIISTVTHEYGHHINNMYLNTSYVYDSWRGASGYIPIDTNSKEIEPANWNRDFVDTFYKTLNYNNKELSNFTGHGADKSISSKVSLFDLFWHSNGKRNISWPDENTHFGTPLYKFKGENGNILYPSFWGEKDKTFNEYRYSLDEIITRQLGQLMNVYKIPDDPAVFGNMVLKRDSGNMVAETFLLDTNSSIQIGINFSDEEEKVGVIGFKKVNGKWVQSHDEGFYKDYIFGHNKEDGEKHSRASIIYDKLIETMGYGKLISNIYAMNKTFAVVNPKTMKINAEFKGDELNHNKFRITGFAPDSVKGIYYGDLKKLKENNLHRFGNLKQRKNLWNFNRKKAVFSQETDPSISALSTTHNDWIPYSTSTYIDAKHNYNSSFGWWVDDNKNNKLDKGELRTTHEIVGTTQRAQFIYNVINSSIPVSTFRKSWGEGLKFPRIVVDNSNKIAKIKLTTY